MPIMRDLMPGPKAMIGTRSREALKIEQARLGLPADGRAGQRILQALRREPRQP